MKIKTLAGAIALIYLSPSFAADAIHLDDIVVTATRTAQSQANIIADMTVIDREQIERAGAGSLTDILRAQPGVQISTNGGAGTNSSVFLRGTNSDHVVVLVDGLRVNSATTGTTSFENIPLGQIERIEILRGPASSLYGADAIGGVIQIFTRKAKADKLLAHAAIGVGTYDTKTAEAGLSGSAGTLKYGVNVSSLDTDSFSAKRIRTGKDKDDDSYRNLSVSAFAEFELAPGHSWGLQFFQSKGHSEFDSNYENFGEQTLQSYAFTSKNQFTDFWHSTFKLGMGVDDSESHARPNNNAAASNKFYNPTGITKYRTEQQQLSWQNDFKLPIGQLTLLYDRLEQEVDSNPGPRLIFKKERNNDAFMANYLLNHDKHTFNLSLREDHNTQFGKFTTGGAGYGYRITPEWRVTASYGKAFKAPTFNQLYYPRISGYSGNPNLIPEESRNHEISTHYETAQLKAGVTIFNNDVENLIVNGDPVKNVNRVRIQGSTFEGSWFITDNLTLAGNFTTQSPRIEKSNKKNEIDQLLERRGNRYGAINLLHTLGDWQWGAEVTGASTRYNDLANTKKMGGYMLVNLTSNYKLSPEWKLEARANNILDKNYALAYTGNTATAVQYNVAGSNLFIGLRYDMKP